MIDKIEHYFAGNGVYAFVLLFGSFNRGTAHAYSDIDIGVFFEGKIDAMQAAYDQARLENALERKVDIVILNDLPEKDPLAAFEILDNHRPLMLKDEQKYVMFKTRAQLSYLDHAGLILSNRRALKQRIESGHAGERDYA